MLGFDNGLISKFNLQSGADNGLFSTNKGSGLHTGEVTGLGIDA